MFSKEASLSIKALPVQKNTFWFKDAVDGINMRRTIRDYITFDHETWITVNTRVFYVWFFFKW